MADQEHRAIDLVDVARDVLGVVRQSAERGPQCSLLKEIREITGARSAHQ
jgi:hypothetical protein